VLAIVLVIMATGAGVALAAGVVLPFSGDGNTINGCYSSTGDLKLLTPGKPTCPKGSTPISWNVTGPPGAQGPQGPKGDQGAQGAQGAQGPKGDPGTGLTSLDQLASLPCSREGEVGTTALSYDEIGRATLYCVGSASVTVNEVAMRTETSVSDAFVEIRNTGISQVDVSGWSVVYLTASGAFSHTLGTIPAGTVLAPNTFLLFAGSDYSGAHPADFSFTTNLASTGAAVGIRNSLGQHVDSVAWGDATNAFVEGSPATAPPVATPGASIIRFPDGHDTDNNAADFTVSYLRTPGEPNKN
jgi:hypothetical protein